MARKSTLPVATYAFYNGKKVTIDDLVAVAEAKGALADSVKSTVPLETRTIEPLPPRLARMVRLREVRRKGFRQ